MNKIQFEELLKRIRWVEIALVVIWLTLLIGGWILLNIFGALSQSIS